MGALMSAPRRRISADKSSTEASTNKFTTFKKNFDGMKQTLDGKKAY